ncbi:MAG: hypothetical protein ABL949_14175 [Fimbriimonadaceae bacterium]
MDILDNIRIAKPCSEAWSEMTGDDRVRHCEKCKLNVFNLAEMTSQEARELIQNREGRTCVRLYQRADGKILTKDCPRGLETFRFGIARALTVAAGLALFCVALAKLDQNAKPGQLTRYKEKAKEFEPIRKIIEFVEPTNYSTVAGDMVYIPPTTGKP